MDFERKDRKKSLRNRDVSIKSGSVKKAKEKTCKNQNNSIKVRIPINSSIEKSLANLPLRNTSNCGNDFEEIVEALKKSGRSSTPVPSNASNDTLEDPSSTPVPSNASNNTLEDPSIQLANNEIMAESEYDISPSRSNNSKWQNENDNMENTKKEGDFMQTIWMKEAQKDIATLYMAFHQVNRDVKEIKKMMATGKYRCTSPLSVPSVVDEDQMFCLLPQFKLKKRKQIIAMEDNVNNNKDYKTQLIKKCATFGGSNIKHTVINIFDGIFTKKLKSKVCWEGTDKKTAFKNLTGIRDVIRQAVNVEFKCSRHDIDKECKLRFNQAQKDYDREKKKTQLEQES